jgi:hypothetical protein
MSEEARNAHRRRRSVGSWERCFTLSYGTLTSGAQCMKASVSIEDTTSKHHALGRCVPLSSVSYALQEHRVQGLDATLTLFSDMCCIRFLME